jgi:general secretion pathway protein F
MARFRYEAYDATGAVVAGEIDAASADDVVPRLRAKSLVAFAVQDAASTAREPWWRRDISFRKSLPRSMLAQFTRELAVLIEAHLTIDEALLLIARRPSPVRALAQSLLDGVKSGKTLSDLVAARSDIEPFYAAMLRAGEAGGHLGQILSELASLIESAARIRARLRAALIYPAILLAMAALTVGIVISVLVPGLMPLFEGREDQMPFLLSTIAWFKWFGNTYWALIIPAVIGIVIAFVILLRMPAFRFAIDRVALSAPLMGPIVMSSQGARFAGTLGALLRGGVPLPRALQVTNDVARNRVIRAELDRVLIGVREGRAFPSLLAETHLPPRLAEFCAVGERAGRLDGMLAHAARMFEEEVQSRIERLMSLVSPLITLAIGLGIGGMVMSVMDAILSINDVAF